MKKRVLVNLEVDPEKPPYWTFLDAELVAAVSKPRFVPPPRTIPRPKAFANPRSWGYGGGETPWPFSVERALLDGRYRAGIRNAIKSDWTASNWKYEAQRLLLAVLDELLGYNKDD